ncbi:MAG: aminoglycoside phosphotransferase family protein [Ilumatobacteraceae bacterium]|nr:aminoglycoside phosphotransferase family protein [Ilumatobacteraceae bacterium]
MTLDGPDAERIADAYGLGGDAVLSGPVARGEVGQVWRLTTLLGAWAIKEPFERPSTDEANDDAAFQDEVFAGGVSMPKVVRTTAGEVLAELESATVRVYQWVDLEQRDAMLDPATVGRIVAAIHRVHFIGNNPVDPWYTDPVGAERWDELIGQLAAAGADFADALAEQRDELVALEELLEWPSNLQTCHRDLFADNVLRMPSGAVCVIDWENSGLADPTQELGLVLFEFGRGEPERTRALYDAYVDAGGPGRIERPSNFSMVIAQLAHIGEISCTRWLTASRHSEQAHNAGRVGEFLTDGITRRMIEGLVDAVSG